MDSNALIQQLLSSQSGTDGQHALESRGFEDIPSNILDQATKLYLEQYGDEGYGGDASMEGIEQIARQIMSQQDSLNASADRNQKAFVNNIPEAERLHAMDPNQPELDEDAWDQAEDIYLDQYGEEGYGGDGSLETIRDMALSLMGRPRGGSEFERMRAGMTDPQLKNYAPPGMSNDQFEQRMGPGSSRPRPDEMFDEYGMENRRRMIPGNTDRAKSAQLEQMLRSKMVPEDDAYSNLNRIGEEAYIQNEGDPLQAILQKMLGGMK